MKKGRCGTMTHDYKRNGTTTLFAALDVLDGRVVGQCFQRHRHHEFLRFLRRLDNEFPGKTIFEACPSWLVRQRPRIAKCYLGISDESERETEAFRLDRHR